MKRVFKELFRLNRSLLTVNADLWISVKKRFGSEERPAVAGLFAEALKQVSSRCSSR